MNRIVPQTATGRDRKTGIAEAMTPNIYVMGKRDERGYSGVEFSLGNYRVFLDRESIESFYRSIQREAKP